MKLHIAIEFGNDAMQTYNEARAAVAHALGLPRRLRNTLIGTGQPSEGDGGKILDVNGNRVGEWEVTE